MNKLLNKQLRSYRKQQRALQAQTRDLLIQIRTIEQAIENTYIKRVGNIVWHFENDMHTFTGGKHGNHYIYGPLNSKRAKVHFDGYVDNNLNG